jgi:hypothetical protein
MSPKIKTLYDLAVESGRIKPEIVSRDRIIEEILRGKNKSTLKYHTSAANARRLRYEREEKEHQALSDKILKSKRHKDEI